MASGDDWRYTFYPPDTYTEAASAAERQRRVDSGEFVMQCDYPGGTKKFRIFRGVMEAFEHIISCQPDERNFYETIFREHRQKPHFDIDIVPDLDDPIEHQDLLRLILTEIKRIIGPELDLEQDIGVYSSHSDIKKSYHVVLTGYYVNDNTEAFNFAKAVLDGVVATVASDRKTVDYVLKSVDMVVYKKMQQFRILGCTKLGKSRFKEIVYEYEAAGRVRRRFPMTSVYEEFSRSLLTVTDGLKYLSPALYTKTPATTSTELSLAEVEAEMKRLANGERKYRHVDPETLWIFNGHEIMAHLIDAGHLPAQLASTWEQSRVLSSVEGAMITLKAPRAGGYPCCACGGHHDHENPYLTLHHDWNSEASTEDKPRVVAVIYRCRRQSKSIRLCSMRTVESGKDTSGMREFTCESEPHDPRVGDISTS